MLTIAPTRPGLRRPLGYAIAAACLVAVFSLAGAPSAKATSCAPHPDARPIAIVRGDERLVTGEPFFTRYDLAVAGTVRSVRTDRRPDSRTYGRTRVRVAVLAAFGTNEIAPTLVVPQSDPGWLNGHFFTRGRTYFIPLRRDRRGGLRNLFVCDPLTEITPGAVALLVAEVRPGLAFTTQAAVVTASPARDGGNRGPWAVAGGMVLVGAAAFAAILGLRRSMPRR